MSAALPWFQLASMPDDCFLDGQHRSARKTGNIAVTDAEVSPPQTGQQTLDLAMEQAFSEHETLRVETIIGKTFPVTKRI